jgi:hypothetical protein
LRCQLLRKATSGRVDHHDVDVIERLSFHGPERFAELRAADGSYDDRNGGFAFRIIGAQSEFRGVICSSAIIKAALAMILRCHSPGST